MGLTMQSAGVRGQQSRTASARPVLLCPRWAEKFAHKLPNQSYYRQMEAGPWLRCRTWVMDTGHVSVVVAEAILAES